MSSSYFSLPSNSTKKITIESVHLARPYYLVTVFSASTFVPSSDTQEDLTQARRISVIPSPPPSPPSVHDDGVAFGEEDVVLGGVEGHAALESRRRSLMALRNTELVLLQHRSEEKESLDSGQ